MLIVFLVAVTLAVRPVCECGQRSLGMLSCLLLPALCGHLLQRLCHSRILQQRLAAWWIHGKLRNRLGEVLFRRTEARVSVRSQIPELETRLTRWTMGAIA